MKRCRDCKKSLSLALFNKDASKKDGRSGQCKKCQSLWHKKYYERNRKKLIAKRMQYYEKNKPLEKFKSSLYQRKNRKRCTDNSKKWAIRNPQKNKEIIKRRTENSVFERRARKLHNYHVNKGNIDREACCICGKKKAEAHHSDYNKPLDAMWMCKTHHAAWHRLFITLP